MYNNASLVNLLALMIVTILLLIITVCRADDIGPLSCYRNYGYTLGVEDVRCAPPLPGSPTYCLKADVYDGRVVRDCASAAQCPQGEGCAPITYDQDGTTDFVCCCISDLCNGATTISILSSTILCFSIIVYFLIGI